MMRRLGRCLAVALAAGAVAAGCRPEVTWPYQPEPFVAPTKKPGLPYVAHSDTVRQFLAQAASKLVFIDGPGRNRAVYCVDYTSTDSFPPARRLHTPIEQDASLTFPIEAPMISPDGEWVAYFITDKVTTSITYVQRLDSAALPVRFADNAAHPHWWEDSTGRLYLLYCSAASGDIALDSGYTRLQEVDPDSPAVALGQPTTLVNDAYNGGISADGRYLFTGDYRSYVYDRVTATATAINPGTQTCNPSFEPDTGTAYRMMFLNIGGPQTLGNDQGSYEQHEIVYIVGPDNAVVQAVNHNDVLPGRGEWQDPEWSNHPDYFAALSQKTPSSTEYDCFIVRIGSPATVLQVNNDEYLKMAFDASPCLWIEGQ